jgi:hypothetical protein
MEHPDLNRGYQDQLSLRYSLWSQVREYKDIMERGGDFRVGPVYRLKTSEGKDLTVYSAVVTIDESNTDVVFIPVIEGKVGGVRQIRLDSHKGDARGSIWTEVRGVGIAYPLELCVIHFLQTEVNKTHATITWKRSDSNAGYYVTEEERQRWLKLYGPDGLLGFERGSRLFVPKSPEEVDPELVKREFRVEEPETVENAAETTQELVAQIVENWSESP